jgi:hypothetical protein
VALAAALCAEPAVASVPDARCPGPPDSFIGLDGTFREAQSFSAQHRGTVVRASIVIDKTNAGGDFLVQILEFDPVFTSLPVNGALGSGTIPDASVPIGTSTQSVTLNAPVSTGTNVLVVSRPGGAPSNLGMRTGDHCLGQEYFSPSPTGDWSEGNPDFDLVYELTVEPSNRFSIHQVTQRKITVIVPGPGLLAAHEAPRPRRKGKRLPRLVKPTQTSEFHSGYAYLPMHLTRAGAATVKAKPVVKAQVLVTFTPIGGQPGAMQIPVPLHIPKR